MQTTSFRSLQVGELFQLEKHSSVFRKEEADKFKPARSEPEDMAFNCPKSQPVFRYVPEEMGRFLASVGLEAIPGALVLGVEWRDCRRALGLPV